MSIETPSRVTPGQGEPSGPKPPLVPRTAGRPVKPNAFVLDASVLISLIQADKHLLVLSHLGDKAVIPDYVVAEVQQHFAHVARQPTAPRNARLCVEASKLLGARMLRTTAEQRSLARTVQRAIDPSIETDSYENFGEALCAVLANERDGVVVMRDNTAASALRPVSPLVRHVGRPPGPSKPCAYSVLPLELYSAMKDGLKTPDERRTFAKAIEAVGTAAAATGDRTDLSRVVAERFERTPTNPKILMAIADASTSVARDGVGR